MMSLLRRSVVTLAFGLVLSAVASAQALFQEGVNFQRLPEAVPVSTGAQIEVLEVFSYVCSHCAHFDPTLQTWKATMPKNAKVVYMPAVFNQAWVPYARAFYAAQQLGILEKSHSKMFKTIFEEQKQFTKVEEIAAWYTQFGVTAKAFTDAFTAPGMEAKLQRVADLTPKYGVEGTPTIVIDGKYNFNVASAGGLDKVGPLLNFLISKAASERGKK
jgi:protein dithiol oxidoreductase (disulfide-forming)